MKIDSKLKELMGRMFGDNIVQRALDKTGMIYHFVTYSDKVRKEYNENLLKLGLCSPKALYDLDREMFRKKSYRIYVERASRYLRKPISEITDEDILDYLDNSPKRKSMGFTSETLFFSFIPYGKIGNEIKRELGKVIEIRININKVEKYTPLLVMYGKDRKITWDEIRSEKFLEWVESVSDTKVVNKKRLFSRIPHLAIPDVYRIEFKKFDSMPSVIG